MKNYLIAFLLGVGLVLAMLVFFWIGKEKGYAAGYEDALNLPVKADTIWRTDTIRESYPVEKYKYIEKPVYIAVVDTQIIHHTDSVYVAVNREVKGYSSEEYRCEVSGVMPSLDWIEVFPKTAYITNTIVKPKRWSFSVTAGGGAFWDGKEIKPGLGVVAGFGYNF